MRHEAQTGFLINVREIRRDIFIPRYYDPRLERSLSVLSEFHNLRTIDDLFQTGELQNAHGKYIPKIHYGTGPYPYIRTTDIANWELKASPKHGVSQAVLEEYSPGQDVKSEDILFVHEGTYLIGRSGIVTPFDGPILYQHHLAKFRVQPTASFDAFYLLAALSTPVVQNQIRSKQFSADIIDSVVGRVGEVVIPISKDSHQVAAIQTTVRDAVLGRARIREMLTYLFRKLDDFLQNVTDQSVSALFSWEPDPHNYSGSPAFLGEKVGFRAFTQAAVTIRKDILVPKYYDPQLPAQASRYIQRCDVVSIAQLESEGVLSFSTGDEIGRMNYGTGTIPFVRTSDFGSYEVLADPKQGVSEDIWKDWTDKQQVEPEDIFVVRDGTYLVGTSTMIFEQDLPLLFCGGIVKIRVHDKQRLPPALLYALLNLPFIKMQMRSKQFTRDIIDTLGHRLGEVVLPIPRDRSLRDAIGRQIHSLAGERVRLRERLTDCISKMYLQP